MNTINWLSTIPEEQRYAALKRLLIDRTRKNKLPLSASFELTPLCNLNCKMCYVRMSPDQMTQKGKVLTSGEWLNLAQEAKEMGVHSIRLTGGEALLRDDFREIYVGIHEMGIYVDVLSNGTLINENVLELFHKYPPANVQVSLYGLSEDEYEKVCGSRSGFGMALSGIKKLKDANINCSLATTLIKDAGDDYLEIHRFAKENNIKHITGVYLHHNRENRDIDVTKLRVTAEQRVEIENNLRNIDGYAELDNCSLEDMGHSEQPLVMKGFLCGGGRNSFHINWRGIMQTCPAFDVLCAFPLKDGLENAWKELVHQVDEVNALLECQTCKHRAYCCTCAAIHYEDTKIFGKVSPIICMKKATQQR